MKGHSFSPFLAGIPGAKNYVPFASAVILRGSEGVGASSYTLRVSESVVGPCVGRWDPPGEEGKPLGGACCSVNTFRAFTYLVTLIVSLNSCSCAGRQEHFQGKGWGRSPLPFSYPV